MCNPINDYKCWLLLLSLWAISASAELRIEISQGVEKAIPVAVVPFGWEGSGAAPFDIAEVVAADLARSGRYAPLPREDMVSRPTEGRQVDFGDWRLLGTDIVVIGRLIAEGGDAFMIEFQVFDVLRGEQLLGYRQPARARSLRSAAHRVADLIYEELTGIKGVFGTRIAYITVTGPPEKRQHQLIVADADGFNDRVLVSSPAPLMSPAWSPDGRKLAYVSFEGNQSAVYVQSLRSGARERVSDRPGVNGAPAWSPDGRKLALTLSKGGPNLDIYSLDIQSQVLTRLTRRASIDTEAAWSSDGREIFFTSDRGGAPQVYRVAAAGGAEPERVTFEGRYNARPQPSPTDSQLAIVHNDRGNYRIAAVDLERRGALLVLTSGELDESPSFAPNGETVMYATRQRGRGILATVSADGRIRNEIAAREGDIREPAWGPFPAN